MAQVFLAISDDISNTKREALSASSSSITAYRQDAYCWQVAPEAEPTSF